MGELRGTGDVTIAPDAIVEANVHVRRLVVHGVVVGHIAATESVQVGSRAQIRGDIRTPQLSLEEGGRVRGRVKTAVSVEAARPTRSMAKPVVRSPAKIDAQRQAEAEDDASAGAPDEGSSTQAQSKGEPASDVAVDESPPASSQEDAVAPSPDLGDVEAEGVSTASAEVVETDDDEPDEASTEDTQKQTQSA